MIGLQVFASGLKRGPIGNTAAVQVAHLPATHPYVHNACGSVRRQPVDVWDVDSLRASGVRVVHVHFGFETRTASDLARWASSLRRTGIGLMHTVHDLDNPHLVDQAPFHRAVEVLVDAADRLLTLTPTAATEVTARFGRRPDVVPHPHVVPLDRMLRRHTGLRRGVYVHAATMRPNLDVELVESLATCARDVGGVRVHVRRGFERSRRGARLLALGAAPGVHVELADELTDEQLWHRLETAAVVVLPYRWGTHSGLLEAAHDLCTPVLAPPIGSYAAQGARTLPAGFGTDDVVRASGSWAGLDASARRHQRDAVRAAHRTLYMEVAGE